jgi:hypothetical protein
MASFDELDARLTVVENILLNSVTLPKISVDVNDTKITDKTGFLVYGQIAGINSGNLFVGVSLVASPTVNADIEEPFVFKAF